MADSQVAKHVHVWHVDQRLDRHVQLAKVLRELCQPDLSGRLLGSLGTYDAHLLSSLQDLQQPAYCIVRYSRCNEDSMVEGPGMRCLCAPCSLAVNPCVVYTATVSLQAALLHV